MTTIPELNETKRDITVHMISVHDEDSSKRSRRTGDSYSSSSGSGSSSGSETESSESDSGSGSESESSSQTISVKGSVASRNDESNDKKMRKSKSLKASMKE